MPSLGRYWLPFRFACGHRLEWGVDLSTFGTEQFHAWLTDSSQYACPMCGSATGLPANPLTDGETRLLMANQVWYRACRPELESDADKNAVIAAAKRLSN